MSNILLLEDDLSLAMHYREALEAAGHAVFHEVNVEQAKVTLSEVQIEIVISDIMIRDLAGQPGAAGGFSLLSHVTLYVRPIPHIIVISGTDSNLRLLEVATCFNANLSMEKPLDVDVLVAEVNILAGQPLSKSISRGIGVDPAKATLRSMGGTGIDVDDTMTPPD